MDPQSVIDMLNNVADWILLTALPGIGLFVIFYAKKSPWKKMFVGRTMMYLAVALGTLFLVNTASIYLGPDYPFRSVIRVLAYSTLSVTVWRLFFTLRKVQKMPFENPSHKAPKNLGTGVVPTSQVDETTQPKPPKTSK